jgi:para-aminobenzoate synthetase / 4-amino-4-deoxychorismate lyase
MQMLRSDQPDDPTRDVAHRWAPRRARLDDAETGTAFEFHGLQRWWAVPHDRSGESLPAVIAAIRDAEEAARRGAWVIGLLTYEAAAAFDPAFPFRPNSADADTAGAAMPLAWFAAYSERVEQPIVSAPTGGPFVADVRRQGGADWYQAGVADIRDRIADGDVYQVNLTDRVSCTLDADPFDLYRSMVHAQGGAYNAFLDLGETIVISASPELFLQVEGHRAITRPMKGTRRRHGRAELDRAEAVALADSIKDRAENVMIVDLLRNDLTRLSAPGGVHVDDLFRIERFETVWQMTSTVRADIRADVDLVDIFRATFPCGSITGAPKIAAMRQIARLEPSRRGVYCGTIGTIEPAVGGERPTSVWSVAIRTAVLDTATGHIEFGAGGGITIDSDPADENDELEAKTAVLRGGRTSFELLETLRLDVDGPRHLDDHLQRLRATAAYFGYPVARAEIEAAVLALPRPQAVQRLRILAARDGSFSLQTLDLDDVAGPVRLAVCESPVSSSDPFLCHKTTHRHTYAKARASQPDADDVILVNERGELVETTIANLLVRLDGTWFTPPLTSGGLAGVGRQRMLDAGEITERVLHLPDLARIEEVAVVSSLRGVRTAVLTEPGQGRASSRPMGLSTFDTRAVAPRPVGVGR